MSILTDNFNDNSRDTAKWSLGTVIFENAGVTVSETNQQLEITPIANEASPAIYGYKSAGTYDFSGLEVRVRLVENFGAPSEAWLIVALDNDNYFRIWAVGDGNLFTRSREAASNNNVDHGTFTFATHTYWKIRHDKITDEITFEYSSDGVSWVELRRIARPFSITTATIYLSGGSGGSSPTPPVVKFDDLVVQGSLSPALFRGRNFTFFDDDEVNRFEFWAAIAPGTTVHDRSVSLSAAGDIASTGESFSVFERAAAVSAAAAIETTAQFFSILERTVSLDAAGTITTTGARVVDRIAAISATASIATSGESFTVFESATSLSATASIESSGIFFSVAERAISVTATATVESAGLRIIERSVSVAATAAIETSGISFSVLSSTTAVSATASVETAAEFLSIFERQSSVDAAATITITRQIELLRQVALSATADISTSGSVVPPGAVEHERSVAVSATGLIETVGSFFSVVSGAVAIDAAATISVSALTVRERSTALVGSAVITVSHQRDLHRALTFSATAGITTSGVVSGPGVAEIERAASLSAVATIAATTTHQHPTPPRRTYVVSSERRYLTVYPDVRVYVTVEPERVEETV